MAAAARGTRGLDRVRLVAKRWSGRVIGEAAAQAALDSLTDALAIRGKLAPAYWTCRPAPVMGPGSGAVYGSPPPLPGGPVRVPLGTTLPPGPARPRRGLPFALVWPRSRGAHRGRVTEPVPAPATQAARCRCRSAPSSRPTSMAQSIRPTTPPGRTTGAGRWPSADPVPLAGTRRLDISGPTINDPIRVELARTPGPGSAAGPDPADPDSARPDPGRADPAHADPARRGGLPGGLSPAERPLDALAERLLANVAHGYGPGSAPLSGLAEVVGALQAVAGLTAGSAALSRLAVLAGRLGIDFPAGLRSLIRPVELPGAWASVLDHRGAADGPHRAAAVAAVLPEVDGARFALAGLDSMADSATLRVLAWGWQPSAARSRW